MRSDTFERRSQIVDKRTMVPIRAIFLHLENFVYWYMTAAQLRNCLGKHHMSSFDLRHQNEIPKR